MKYDCLYRANPGLAGSAKNQCLLHLCFSVLQKPGPLSKKKPEFRHPCVSCEKRFLTLTGLKQHMESAHPQSLQDYVPMPDVPDVKSSLSGNIHI